MKTTKLFIQLNDADYNSTTKRYTVRLDNPITFPERVSIHSVSVTTPVDSDWLLVSSNKLHNLAKNPSNMHNSEVGSIIYTLHPELRVVRDLATGGDSGSSGTTTRAFKQSKRLRTRFLRGSILRLQERYKVIIQKQLLQGTRCNQFITDPPHRLV